MSGGAGVRCRGSVLMWPMPRTGMATAWLGRYRRFSKNYKGLSQTSETWIRLAMKDHMMYRLIAG